MPQPLDRIKAISYFTTSLFDKQSVEEVFWDLTKNVIHKLGFEDCVVYLLDESRNTLIQQAAYGQKNPEGHVIYNRIEIPAGNGIVGSCAASGKPVLVPDTRLDARYIVDDKSRLSELAVPILMGETVYGVIDSEHSNAGFFSEEDVHLLTIIAAICAQKIKDIRNRTQPKLDAENEYYQAFLALFEQKRIFKNPDLSLESTAQMLGISAGYLSRLINTITGKSFSSLLNEYRVEEVKRNLKSNQFRHYSLLSIGLEAGFNSKASFIRNFKAQTGTTPAAFLASVEQVTK
jgi:AraC-like DNA-binding protein